MLTTLTLVRVESERDWEVVEMVVLRAGDDFDSTFFRTGKKLFLAGMARCTDAVTLMSL